MAFFGCLETPRFRWELRRQPATAGPTDPFSLRVSDGRFWGASSSPRAAATSLSALVLHEAHGTGTALGGGLLRDAATCRGSSSHIHTACVGLKAEDEETGAQAPASACTAAQPHPPPGLPPTLLPETVEDPKRALVHALQNDLSRMSVLLERLDELLSA